MPGLAQNSMILDDPTPTHRSQGGRLVSPKGQDLPLRSVELTADAAGGLARTRVRQVFANPYEEPLNVHYSLPLPASGAVAGFEVKAGQRVIRGEIDRRAKAQQRFERAQLEGRTAALLDQERPDIFTQNLGNIPPKEDVTVTLTIDQQLGWLSEGQWEWRFPTVIAPRYLGPEGRVPDAGRVTQDVTDQDTGVRATLKLTIADEIHGAAPSSPSHALATDGNTLTFAAEHGAALDRDVVVRWGAARPRPGVSLRRARPPQDAPHAGSAYGVLTMVPPAVGTQVLPRDLIVLLDVSGSMRGLPIDHARKVVVKLIESLTDRDRLQMVAFANSPEHWRKTPAKTDASARQDALSWVHALRAGGATEMISAIDESLKPLRDEAQRQVVLITDGLIGFETEAIRAIRKGLPQGSRLHTVGVGSATNDAFLHSAARAGRGTQVQVGLDEDAEKGGAGIVAATRGPVVVDVQVTGSAVEACAPNRPPDLMEASPVCLGLRLRPEGGELTVSGSTAEGAWQQHLTVPPTTDAEGESSVTALYAREAVEDLELDLACGAQREEVDRAIEKIGLEFGISTRLTSWVAISAEPTVDRRQPVREERIPQMLPYGMSAEGLGLSAARMRLRPAAAMDCLVDDAIRVPVAYKTDFELARLLGDLQSGPIPARRIPSPLGQLVERLTENLAGRIAAREERWSGLMERIRETLGRLHALSREKPSWPIADPESLRKTLCEMQRHSRDLENAAQALQYFLYETRDETAELSAEYERLIRAASELELLPRQPSLTVLGRALESPDGTSSIIQCRIQAAVDWVPPSEATIIGQETIVKTKVKAEGTTRGGRIAANSVARVEIDLPIAELGKAHGVMLRNDAASIWVELRRPEQTD